MNFSEFRRYSILKTALNAKKAKAHNGIMLLLFKQGAFKPIWIVDINWAY